jgi:uncharacterized membrane protein YdbT with pleckstrin-like domain
MSTYAKQTLQPGERIIRVARLHWVIYTSALLYGGLALSVALVALFMPTGVSRLGFAMAAALTAVAARNAFKAWWHQFTTEMAITNRRVIFKTGFVQRHTDEMFLDRIESVFVDQGVLGRIFNYGTIHCRGVGDGLEHLHHIADPLAVQNAINAK